MKVSFAQQCAFRGVLVENGVSAVADDIDADADDDDDDVDD